MSTEILVAIVVAAIIAVGVVAWFAGQRRKSEQLRDRFGPEYERTVEVARDPKKAEAELEARAERVDSLDIKPLNGPDRARFGERWRVIQTMFVDDPAMAVEEADSLIGKVMRARGYPVGDFEQRAADISVNHPQVVDHYRTAHRIAEKRIAGDVDTEQLRQAFVHYRALFADLLESDEARRNADTGANLARAADMRAAGLHGRAAVPADGPSRDPAVDAPADRAARADVYMTEQPRDAGRTADARAEEAAAGRRGRDTYAAGSSEEPAEPARRP